MVENFEDTGTAGKWSARSLGSVILDAWWFAMSTILKCIKLSFTLRAYNWVKQV
jgi:hypothetical protein